MILSTKGPLLGSTVRLLVMVLRIKRFRIWSDEMLPVAVLEEGDLRRFVDPGIGLVLFWLELLGRNGSFGLFRRRRRHLNWGGNLWLKMQSTGLLIF